MSKVHGDIGSMLWKEKVAKSEGYAEGVEFTAKNYSAVVLLCLKDKFDFTTDQLKEVSGHINSTFDSICGGYLTLQDIMDTLEEENHIHITFGGKCES